MNSGNTNNFDDLSRLIYVVRGVKVMLDADLAAIYGYTTKAFNQQVKYNIKKFDEDFRFQLTKEEYDEILRSKILTSKQIIMDSLSIDNKNDLDLRSKSTKPAVSFTIGTSFSTMTPKPNGYSIAGPRQKTLETK